MTYPPAPEPTQINQVSERNAKRALHMSQVVAMLDALSNEVAGGARANPFDYMPGSATAGMEPAPAGLGGIPDKPPEIDYTAEEASGVTAEGTTVGASSGSDLYDPGDLATSADVRASQKGLRNGYIPKSRLTAISGANPGGGQGYLLDVAAEAWEAMRKAAAADGVNLHYSSTYRSYATQAAAYRDYKAGKRGKGVVVARPGTSKHGAGLAVDVSDGVGIVGRNTAQWQWLAKNGSRFGWYPIRSETWHWEYRGT